MGLPVKIFKSTDQGAPVIKIGKPSEMITVLKKCLVEGYGDKSPLGWTLAFEDASKFAAVFRNDNAIGSGGYFQINGTGYSNANDNSVRIHVAKLINGIDVFIEKLTMRQVGILKEAVTGWCLVGTSRGFWFFTESVNTTAGFNADGYANGSWYIFIGDIDHFDPNDAAPFTIVHGVNTVNEWTNTYFDYNIGSSQYIGSPMFAANGESTKSNYFINYGNLLSNSDVNVSIIPSGSPIHFNQVIPILNGSFNNVESESSPIVRGQIPGFYQSSSIGGRTMTQYYHDLGGDTYRLVRGRYTPFLWIKVSGEWYEH